MARFHRAGTTARSSATLARGVYAISEIRCATLGMFVTRITTTGDGVSAPSRPDQTYVIDVDALCDATGLVRRITGDTIP